MLTDTKLKKLKGRQNSYRIFDKTIGDPGFGVRVTPNGHVSFFQMYNVEGKRRFMNLGSYSDWKLSEARDRAREARKQLDKNEDPQDIRDAEKKDKAEKIRRKKTRGTVDNLFDCYADWLESQGKRSANPAEKPSRTTRCPVGRSDSQDPGGGRETLQQSGDRKISVGKQSLS